MFREVRVHEIREVLRLRVRVSQDPDFPRVAGMTVPGYLRC